MKSVQKKTRKSTAPEYPWFTHEALARAVARFRAKHPEHPGFVVGGKVYK